jgi:hypothetical protein
MNDVTQLQVSQVSTRFHDARKCHDAWLYTIFLHSIEKLKSSKIKSMLAIS